MNYFEVPYIKHLSRDYATRWIKWLEDESAVWDIQIDTKKYFDTWFYRCFVMMRDADTQYSIGNTTIKRNTRNKSCLFSLYVTTHQKGENEFLIYIISMLNDWRERHPM